MGGMNGAEADGSPEGVAPYLRRVKGAMSVTFRPHPRHDPPDSALELPRYCTELGISSVDVMGDAAEAFAWAIRQLGAVLAPAIILRKTMYYRGHGMAQLPPPALFLDGYAGG